MQRVAQAGDPRFAALSLRAYCRTSLRACLESAQPAKRTSEVSREMAGASFLSTAPLVVRGVAACSSISTPTRRHPHVRTPPELITGLPVEIPFHPRRNRVILGLPAQIRVCCRADGEGSEAAAHEERLQFRRRHFIGTCVGTAIGLVRASATILTKKNQCPLCIGATEVNKCSIMGEHQANARFATNH